MASSSDFKIRVKTQSGSFVLSSLNAESSMKELKEHISKEINLSPESIKILYGYPPRPLSEQYDNLKLKELDIKAGDRIIAEKKTDITKPSASASERDHKYAFGDMAAIFEDIYSGGSIMMRQVVPSNNSCLFTSIHFLMSDGDLNAEKSAELRNLIAREVAGNPDKYTSVFLGMENKDYCMWIQNPDHWGGAIELSILSDHYKVEIVAVDTSTLVMHRFGENSNFIKRIFVIYDGIHYDPLFLETDDGAPRKTIFPTMDQRVMEMALELAQEAKSSRQFTDVTNFTLKCLICGQGLRGQKEAKEHAMNTGHTSFGETDQ